MESFNADTAGSPFSKDGHSSPTAALMQYGDGISMFDRHSHTWLFPKVLCRFLLSLLLALSLVLYIFASHHHQACRQLLQNSIDLMRPFQDQKESASYFGKSYYHGGISQSDEHAKEDDEAAAHVHRDDSLLGDQHGNRGTGGSLGHSMELHQSLNIVSNRRALEPKKIQLTSSISFASNSAIPYRLLKPNGRHRRPNIRSLLKIFQGLSDEGLLKLHHRILCLDYKAGKEVAALKKQGFDKVVGIDPLLRVSKQKVTQKQTFTQYGADESFDLVFTRMFDEIPHPALFVAEIERILKVGGFAAMHVSLDVWRNKFISSELGHAMKPVTLQFQLSKIVYVSTAYARGLDTIIVFEKTVPVMVAAATDLDGTDKRSYVFVPVSQSAENNAVHPSTSQSFVDNAVSSSQPKAGSTFLYIAKWAGNNAAAGVCKVLSRLSSFVDSLVKDVSYATWTRKLMIGHEFLAVQVDIKGTISEVRKLKRAANLFDELRFKCYHRFNKA